MKPLNRFWLGVILTVFWSVFISMLVSRVFDVSFVLVATSTYSILFTMAGGYVLRNTKKEEVVNETT